MWASQLNSQFTCHMQKLRWLKMPSEYLRCLWFVIFWWYLILLMYTTIIGDGTIVGFDGWYCDKVALKSPVIMMESWVTMWYIIYYWWHFMTNTSHHIHAGWPVGLCGQWSGSQGHSDWLRCFNINLNRAYSSNVYEKYNACE